MFYIALICSICSPSHNDEVFQTNNRLGILTRLFLRRIYKVVIYLQENNIKNNVRHIVLCLKY